MDEIIFEVNQEADGGFVAECLTESIFTQGDTWEELRRQVRDAVKEYFFDSFECAVSMLAPECTHCKTKIIGHGLESAGMIFCCANCANHSGIFGFKDNIEFEEESMSFDED